MIFSLLLLIFLTSIYFDHAEHSISSVGSVLHSHNPKTSSSIFTVTSVIFNPTKTIPQWFDYTFGNRSIYFLKQKVSTQFTLPLYEAELSRARRQVYDKVDKFDIMGTLASSICSFELLGYVELNHFKPYYVGYKGNGPIIGTGYLTLHIDGNSGYDIKVTCYYRALFENVRRESGSASPYHWANIFYCPVSSVSTCATIRERTSPVSITVTMISKFKQLEYRFVAQDLNRLPSSSSSSNLAVCLPIPYQSSKDSKISINRAILSEWVRYYAMLGFTVMIYDRDGLNHDAVISAKQSLSNSNENTSIDIIYYFNHTMRQLLAPSSRFRFDNTEIEGVPVDESTHSTIESAKPRLEAQDNDKVMTLTHCRFEAKALFNIVNVMVTDSDEFLYCPRAGMKAFAQASFVAKHLAVQQSIGIQQVIFPQRIVSNITSSLLGCMHDKIQRQQSILLCFASYRYQSGGHSYKSIHLGHYCPLTGYHESCPTDENPRTIDCQCKSTQLQKNYECSYIHLTTNMHYYQTHYQYLQRYQAKYVRNEIYSIMYTK